MRGSDHQASHSRCERRDLGACIARAHTAWTDSGAYGVTAAPHVSIACIQLQRDPQRLPALEQLDRPAVASGRAHLMRWCRRAPLGQFLGQLLGRSALTRRHRHREDAPSIATPAAPPPSPWPSPSVLARAHCSASPRCARPWSCQATGGVHGEISGRSAGVSAHVASTRACARSTHHMPSLRAGTARRRARAHTHVHERGRGPRARAGAGHIVHGDGHAAEAHIASARAPRENKSFATAAWPAWQASSRAVNPLASRALIEQPESSSSSTTYSVEQPNMGGV